VHPAAHPPAAASTGQPAAAATCIHAGDRRCPSANGEKSSCLATERPAGECCGNARPPGLEAWSTASQASRHPLPPALLIADEPSHRYGGSCGVMWTGRQRAIVSIDGLVWKTFSYRGKCTRPASWKGLCSKCSMVSREIFAPGLFLAHGLFLAYVE